MSDLPLDQSLVTCLETVKRLDPDRYLTALLAPETARAKLIALYAFNTEIARVRETVSEPMLGQIRLQWWRETVDAIAKGEARGHEAAVALASAFTADEFDANGLTELIDARERDLDDEPFEDMEDLLRYCAGTSSGLMELAARAVSPDYAGAAKGVIKSAGIAYALTGLLRALPLHASQGRLYVPLSLLRQNDIDPHEIFAGKYTDGLRSVVQLYVDEARHNLKSARQARNSMAREVLPALWPASLCDAYLSVIAKPDFNPFRDAVTLPPLRLQMRLMGRKLLGRF
ncbi:MAG: phytoene/squalene synthase family protein [Parvibaculum sp.]|nr:phytoene/squalene synthase family protein [Parvibaculum sp.]